MSSKITQLQLLQQNLQNLLLQKQQIESQLAEIDSALEETKKAEKMYKIIGKIMVASSSAQLQSELRQGKENYGLRLKNIAQQEEKIQQTLRQLQQEVMEELGQKK